MTRNAETFHVIHIDFGSTEAPDRLRWIAGGIGGLMRLSNLTVDIDRLSNTIATPTYQLILNVADLMNIRILVALSTIGNDQD